MKAFLAAAVLVSAFAGFARAQVRPGNWAGYGGDPQRSGWERTDGRINKDSAKNFQLLWKLQLDPQPKGSRPLMPPVVIGNLISYRGFKELALVATSSDVLYAIDADLGTVFWTKHLEYVSRMRQAASSSADCPGGLTAMPVMPSPPPRPARPPAAPAPPVPAAGGRGPASRGPFESVGTGSIYALSSDGRLHRINTSTGDDLLQPVQVLPSNASAANLNFSGNVIYTVTAHGCNGAADAVWAIDLTAEPPKVTSFALPAASSGPALGEDGTVYVQTPEKLLALSSGTLDLKDSFTLAAPAAPASSPLLVSDQNRELIATADRDGHMYLLDSTSLGGANHRSPLYRTPAISNIGGLSSWRGADGTAWVLAAVRGPVNSGFRPKSVNGPAPDGSIVAFKIEQQNGKTVLNPVWVSRNLISPQTPVIAGGVVFALSSAGPHATLYALDAETGKELYSTGNMVTAPAVDTGLTVANGRVYFGTTDGTVYAFGIYMEH